MSAVSSCKSFIALIPCSSFLLHHRQWIRHPLQNITKMNFLHIHPCHGALVLKSNPFHCSWHTHFFLEGLWKRSEMPFLPSSLSGTPGMVSYSFLVTLFWLPLPGLWLPSLIPTLRQTPPRNFSPQLAQKLLDGLCGVFSECQTFSIGINSV